MGRANPLQHQDLAIDAVCHKGRIPSLNSRRLWALKQHKTLHAKSDVRVRVLAFRGSFWALAS